MNKQEHLLKYIAPIFVIILFSSNTYAFETCKTAGGKDIKWKTPNATYFINTSGGPSGSLSAIEAGMQTWTDVPPSSFTFVYGGTTTSTGYGINDGTNIVTFGPLGAGIVAENSYWYNTVSGKLIDSDIQFNTNYPWSSTAAPDAFDVQNVGTHEHGHSLCLVDLYSAIDSEKTMYGYVSYGETKKRTLHKDDIDGITFLYPASCSPSVRIAGATPVYYSTLQSAYDAAVNGDTIQSQAVAFSEDLFIDLNKSVTLKGGYDCDYIFNTGKTTLNGNMTISNGMVTIENFILE